MIAPHIDPVALQIGPLAIHWYGLMYVAGFFLAWYLVRRQLMTQDAWNQTVTSEQYEGLFTTLILGVILGGRLGYVLFYNFGYYIGSSHRNPLCLAGGHELSWWIGRPDYCRLVVLQKAIHAIHAADGQLFHCCPAGSCVWQNG